MNQQALYEAIKETANWINAIDPEYGEFALRKVASLSADSDIEALIRAGDDIELIVSKVQGS